MFCREMPSELANEAAGVRVSLEDHWHEDYQKQPAKTHAFTGKGQMLGRFVLLGFSYLYIWRAGNSFLEFCIIFRF
jgi:hypothetical protein